MSEATAVKNPLGTAPIGSLVRKYALPSIVAMLVGAVYNIVDQIFIGQFVGTLGNAATNICFPLTTSCIAISLLCGIGAASNFNLAMGRRESSDAAYYIGNGVTLAVALGTLLLIISQLFTDPLLMGFGSTADVLPYATDYVRVVSIGFPFLILTTSGGHIIRADGSPRIAMLSNASGAVLNVGLDALFVAVFGMGMTGAALATIIGQILSAIIVTVYLTRYKTVHLGLNHLKIKWKYTAKICSLGAASMINQIAMMVTQIALNNTLKVYGALSPYGSEIPIAAAGIIMKINQVFFSIVIGISQGSQPIFGYNYGARNYKRVRKAYAVAITSAAVVSIIAFLLAQFAPRPMLAIFDQGSEAYFEFGERFFRIFLFGMCVLFMQPITSTFFTSIGKPYKGIFMSLTRQILFLLPLIIVFPLIWGLDGLLFAGPIADALSFLCALIMIIFEFRTMKNQELTETPLD
ncbi:MAG: MATE family efflux transporter [Lachnospiraceae bacterium]|nr:MATE family efflux transporter [Lachnospiraceae bacterium]